MAVTQNSPPIDELEGFEPEALLKWASQEYGERAGIVTSFQTTGCVMIDMASRVAPEMRVITIDTLRLHPETYALMDEIEARYGLHIERFQPIPEHLDAMIEEHGEYLFFDSKTKQEYCCGVRKVDPNQRALATLDVWFTGLRRDQSEFRNAVPKVSRAHQPNDHSLLKIAPLAEWTEDDVDAYVAEHNAPKNVLYDQGYDSIGCVICTTPIRPHEEKRTGRWRWFNQFDQGGRKECGIHTHGGGI